MDRSKDLVMISRADITILDQEVLGVLGKVRGFKDTDSWGTVGLEWCWGKLWVSEPGEVGSVELDVFGCDRECVVLGVGRIERDLCGLDLADDVEGSIVLAYAERDGQTVTGWTAKAASQEAMSLGPSVVYQVGPRSIEPFR